MSESNDIGSLSSLQKWMQEALISEEDSSAEEIGNIILPSSTLQPAQRLAIYQRGYYARLLQCLEGQFKALRHALGAELFSDFGREYLREFPSQNPSLSELGACFVHFLQKNRPDADADEKEMWVDFMIDLARFEWDLYVLFDVSGNEGKKYADENTEDDFLVLQPAVSLGAYGFPAGHYYREVSLGNDPQVPLPMQSQIVLVRKDFKTGIINLLPAQYFFLCSMKEGLSVTEALNGTMLEFSSTSKAVASAWRNWKKEWVKWGMFAEKPAI